MNASQEGIVHTHKDANSFRKGLIITAIVFCVAVLIFAFIGVKSVFARTPFDSDIYRISQIAVDTTGDNTPDVYIYVSAFLAANRAENGSVGVLLQGLVNQAVPLK